MKRSGIRGVIGLNLPDSATLHPGYRLARVSGQIAQLEAEQDQLQNRRVDAAKRISAAVASQSEALIEHNQTRREAIKRLTQFVTLGLLDSALPDHSEEIRKDEWPSAHRGGITPRPVKKPGKRKSG